ncbi:MAG TPA: SMP-30/gluconolactonase/LRE family protein [Acidobacteria bacterium]|nr:SMP-30/gluconolactonase/LRE family protein [Acidobacteriota bacterium]
MRSSGHAAQALCVLVAGGLLAVACDTGPTVLAPDADIVAEPLVSPREVSVAATVAFTEGPTVAEDGTVFFTDIDNNRILRMSPAGEVSTFRQPSNAANGLIFDTEWRLLACEGGDGETALPRVTRTDMATGAVEVLADHYEGKELHRPNDLTFDGQGRIYFTDRPEPNARPDQTGVHGVYRVDPDGSVTRILTEPEVIRPNGIVISPDDTTLYLLETEQSAAGPRLIRAYDLSEDGTVSNMRVFHDFHPGRSGDGMTVDSGGNLYVAAGPSTPSRASMSFRPRVSCSNTSRFRKTPSRTPRSAALTCGRSMSRPARLCSASGPMSRGHVDEGT